MVTIDYNFDNKDKIRTHTQEIIIYDGTKFYGYTGIKRIEENKTTPQTDINAGGAVWATLKSAPKKIDGTATFATLTAEMRKVLLGHTVTGNGSQINETTIPGEVTLIVINTYSDALTTEYVAYPRVTFSEPNESYVGDDGAETITATDFSLGFTALQKEIGGIKVLRDSEDVSSQEEADAFLARVTGTEVTG